MGLATVKKDEPLHERDRDTVSTVEVLVKGQVQMDNGIYTLRAGTGAILGLAETPGTPYKFTYTATADSQIISYAYTSPDDVASIIRANAKICPVLATECVRLVMEALNIRAQKLSQVQTAYENVLNDYAAYPSICEAVGEYPQSYETIKKLLPPSLSDGISEWEIATVRGLIEHADTMRTQIYALSPDLSAGIIMNSARFYNAVTQACIQIYAYEEQLREDTQEFTSAYQLMRARVVEKERQTAFDGDAQDAPAIENALETILSYAQADQKVTEEFRDSIHTFRENPGRYATTDDARMVRRNLGKLFYEIYFAAFLRSMEHPESVPSEVKMLFMFGFVDEVLAGEENTSMLYSILRSYKPDPAGKVLTAYEWLQKIYRLEAEPSRNEFDQDYPTYLRELKTSGDASPEQIEQMREDPKSRFLFEARNFFTIGGRVTFGHAASFVPFFDKLNVTRPLAKAYINTETVNDILNRIRGVDFGLFSRQRSYFNQEIGVNQLFLDEVVMPYMVLTPIVGFRGSLWQEIEGKDRGTPARMLLPIIFTEEPDNCLLRLSGEFRWEMCKTEQGVHWNDVSDPSLTALYCDYLQFYKKNRMLSEDNKEKLKTTLKKFNNDYKNVFINDYITYITFEAAESPRLNKVAREILFTFCPFPKEMREKMADNPQYRELIKKHENQQAGKIRPLAGLIKRLQKDGIEVPEEMMQQYRVLQQ